MILTNLYKIFQIKFLQSLINYYKSKMSRQQTEYLEFQLSI